MEYQDKMGRNVNINIPVKRAVFLQMYELIPALDLWNSTAGVARWAYENDLMLAAKADIKRTIPAAGNGIDVNIEALLKMNPDAVITWTYKPEQVQFMEEKGLHVIAIYPDSLKELYDVMRLLGRIFKKERRTEASINHMEEIFRMVRQRTAHIPLGKRQKVLWLGSRQNTVGGEIGVTQDIFTLIGGINAAGHIKQRSADVPIEKIIAWNPDVIFIWGSAKYTARDIVTSPQWRFIRAVKDGRVYKAPEWSTWSPRIAPVALWMAMKTYPEYFKDVNLDKVTDSFYRKTYGISYARVKKIEN